MYIYTYIYRERDLPVCAPLKKRARPCQGRINKCGVISPRFVAPLDI